MAAMTDHSLWAFSSLQQLGEVAALEANWTKEEVSTGVRYHVLDRPQQFKYPASRPVTRIEL